MLSVRDRTSAQTASRINAEEATILQGWIALAEELVQNRINVSEFITRNAETEYSLSRLNPLATTSLGPALEVARTAAKMAGREDDADYLDAVLLTSTSLSRSYTGHLQAAAEQILERGIDLRLISETNAHRLLNAVNGKISERRSQLGLS